MSTPVRAFARHDPRRALGRLVLGLLLGGVTAMAMPLRFGGAMRAIAAWDVGAGAVAALAWWLILHSSVAQTRHRAAEVDPGRRMGWAIVIVASTFSLFATAAVLRGANECRPEDRGAMIGLCLAAVGVAWLLTHTMYALRYAHLYYRDDGDGEGGLGFPERERPAYIDFAYVALTVGMCFQTSDVSISSRAIRRAVLGQAVLSFAYNTAILATAVNLVVGFLH